MHKAIRSLIAFAGLLAGCATLHAQAALKVVVVDMAKVYDTHYKTEEANAKFNDAAQRAQEQLEKLNQDIQKAVEDYKGLIDQSKSPMANDQARAKATEDAQKKMQEIQGLQNQAQEFRVNTQRSLQTRAKNHRDLIMDEIMKVVNEISRAKGATLVLDKSGPSVFGVPVVLYADSSYDITDEVVKEVNKDRPASTPAAAPAATPSAPAANSNPAGFTVPNVTTPPKKG